MTALKLEDIKKKLTQDINLGGDKGKEKKDKKERKEEGKINSLPEYTIRTMKDDVAEASLGVLEKEAKGDEGERELFAAPGPTPEEEVPEARKSALPGTEELIKKEKEKEEIEFEKGKKPTKEVSFATPPVDLPVEKGQRQEKKTESTPAPVPSPPKEPTKAKIMKESIGRKIPRPVIFGIIGFIMVFAIGGFLYWQIGQPEPEPEPIPEPGPKLSQALISSEEIVKPKLSDYSNLSELLKQESRRDQVSKTFKRIGVLRNDQEFLSLSRFFQNLGIAIPPYSLAQLTENYNLVLYSQNGKRRIGIIVEVQNLSTLKEQLKYWENTMVNDLKNMFLGESLPTPAISIFQDNVYRGNSIRFINFPDPELTIDYAIVNNYFILTTSRESMYGIIDRIVDNL